MTSLRRTLFIWLVVLVVILVGSQLIVTDSKRVHGVLRACEKAVRAADPNGLMTQIAPDYEYQELDWGTLRQLARTIFVRNQFSTTWLRNIKIKVDAGSAEVHFSALVEPGQGSALPASISEWRLKLHKRGNTWLITEIEMLTLDGRSVRPLKEMMEEAASMGGE